MASSSPIAGGPSQGSGRDSVASAKNHQIGHGAAMGYSSMHPASSRKAGRSVEAGARRPAVATITPAPPVNGVVGERVACRGVKGGAPRRIGRAGLAKLIGRILIAGLGTVLPRLGKYLGGGDLGIGANRRRPGRQGRASPDFRFDID